MKKDALILALITLVAGLLLGGVYELTKDARAKQAERTRNNAYRAVFENSEDFSFEEVELSKLTDLDSSLKAVGLSGKLTIDGFVIASDKDENTVGYIANVTSKEGYGGDISFSVGISTDGTVTGISILTISETPGLGMKAKEDSFLNQYVSKDGMFVVGENSEEGADSIDAISGATITSKAMTNGVNGAMVAYNTYILAIAELNTEIETTLAGGEASDE